MGWKDWIAGNSEGNSASTISEVAAPVDESLLWICEKCGMKLKSKDDNPSRKLQKEVKSVLSEQARKKKVRAMVTSCLNICPKDKFALCIVHFGRGKPSTQFFELEPSHDNEAMAKAVLAKLDE